MNSELSKFWKWLYLLAKEKVREKHLNVFGNDIRCPNCKEWFSISGVEHENKHTNTSFGTCWKCGKCGHITYWNYVAAPVPLRCDSRGNPIINTNKETK